MTATVEVCSPPDPTPTETRRPSWLGRPLWHRFTPLQLAVLVVASVAPLVVIASIGAAAIGLISLDAMTQIALAAGENPGMVTFGAVLLASPIQWVTGRSQVRVRKYLGIVFFLLALSNGAMFVLESGLGAAVGAPFLVAGTIALALATPLFLTSSRRAQRALGRQRWRRLHKLTYLVAIALVAHVVLLGDIGPGFVLITCALIARVPAVRRRLIARRRDRHDRSELVRPDGPSPMDLEGDRRPEPGPTEHR